MNFYSEVLPMLLIMAVFIVAGGFAWRRRARKTACCLWALVVWWNVNIWLSSRTTPESRQIARKHSCIANLKQMDGAVQQWAEEHKKRPDDPVEIKAMKSYLKGSQLRECPGQGTYSFGRIKDGPKCSLAAKGHAL